MIILKLKVDDKVFDDEALQKAAVIIVTVSRMTRMRGRGCSRTSAVFFIAQSQVSSSHGTSLRQAL